jgi:UDP-N-acetylmuramoylalanine--D-glutamate ligase
MSVDIIIERLKDKNILLLGFGKEGQSSYAFIRKYFPNIFITIADKNPENILPVLERDSNIRLISGECYLDAIHDYDIVLKSPGISLKSISLLDRSKISSQTDLFLQAFALQCIGVTGTKGKSTTTSLLYHILQSIGNDALIAGNIGVPFFDVIEKINPLTKIVLELSSHQLEFISKAPHISILLNLFEEHLDHYRSFNDYQQAKFNIARYQSISDCFIYNTTDELILNLLKNNKIESKHLGFSFAKNEKSVSYVKDAFFCFLNRSCLKLENVINRDCFVPRNDDTEQTEKRHCEARSNLKRQSSIKEEKIVRINEEFLLKGEHNLLNVTAVIAALQCMDDIDNLQIEKALYTFKGLEHRLERVGEFDGIIFYNDSISTIPQASVAAVNALKDVDTIILGGFDRGIDYQFFIEFLEQSGIHNFIFTGDAGKRMMKLFNNQENKNLYFLETYSEIVELAKKCTQKGKICLLSPAAASYDQFKNFEHRGNIYKQLIINNKIQK